MLFIFSFIAMIISTLWILSIIRFKSKISFLFGAFIIFFVKIVAIGHIGHTLSLLNSIPFYLLAMSILFVSSFFVWRRHNYPSMLGPLQSVDLTNISIKKIFQSPWKDLYLLFIFTVLVYAISLYVGIKIPPNNNDSIAVHLSRILYWLQNGNYNPWPTVRYTQLIYPVNSSLILLWSMLLSNSDKFVAGLNWISAIICSIGVYGIAKMLGAKKEPAVFTALIFLSYPIVLLQSSTTQTGLISGALLAITIYFFFNGIHSSQRIDFIFSGIALGLVLGNRHTAFFILPGLGLSFLYFWLILKKLKGKNISFFISSTIITFLFLGSQIYFMNYSQYGNPLGPKEIISRQIEKVSQTETDAPNLLVTISRFLFQAADPSTLPSPFWRYGVEIKGIVGEKIFSWLNIPIAGNVENDKYYFDLYAPTRMGEDTSWYGLLGFLVIMPTFLVASYKGFKNKDDLIISIFLIAAFYFVTTSLLTTGWSLNRGRYFVPSFFIATPLAYIWFEEKRRRIFFGLFTLFVAGFSMAFTIIYNPAKELTPKHIPPLFMSEDDPFYDGHSFYWNMFKNDISWGDMVGMQTEDSRLQYSMLDNNAPQDATVAFIAFDGFFRDYGYFGENFTRTVVPIYPDNQLYNLNWLDEKDIDYILVIGYQYFDLENIPGFEVVEKRLDNLLMAKIIE
jgi:hypothetical protein